MTQRDDRSENYPPGPGPSEIDAENRGATPEIDTRAGEFVVEAVETYNWRRPTRGADEIRELQEAATGVIEEWTNETEASRGRRDEFLVRLREAAQTNGDATGENAVAAVRALMAQMRAERR